MHQIFGGPQTPTKQQHMNPPEHLPSTPPDQIVTPSSPHQVQHTIIRLEEDIMFCILGIPLRVRIQKLKKAISMSLLKKLFCSMK